MIPVQVILVQAKVLAQVVRAKMRKEKKEKEAAGGGSTSQTTTSSSEKIEVTELLNKSIIGNSDKEVNWEFVKNKIENLYSTWSTISIDLAEVNVPTDRIDSFSSLLNDATSEIKEEKKSESIQKLVDIYGNILDFYNGFNNNLSLNEKRIKEIKYNTIIAYENVEIENWEEARRYINEAQKKNTEILSDIEDTNMFNIKKINIILNQVLSSLDTKDKEIFYINYRNLIEEVNLV